METIVYYVLLILNIIIILYVFYLKKYIVNYLEVLFDYRKYI